jgi:hypothetical protein
MEARKSPSPVPFLQPPQPDPPGCGHIAPTGCGVHHETAPGVCCCGGPWPGTLTCHPCRNPGHTAEDCVDGPPPADGRYGTGRKCSCQHKPAGTALAVSEAKP